MYEDGSDYEKALKEAGGTIHLKLFEKGGHGMSGCDWFSVATEWMKAQQVIR